MCGVVGTVRNVNRNHQIQTLHPVERILKVNQSESQDIMIPVTSIENHLLAGGRNSQRGVFVGGGVGKMDLGVAGDPGRPRATQ